jgi:hypothetical protein
VRLKISSPFSCITHVIGTVVNAKIWGKLSFADAILNISKLYYRTTTVWRLKMLYSGMEPSCQSFSNCEI